MSLDPKANHNKYIVDNGLPFGQGGKVTGLVHPKNRAEAEAEQIRLGVEGKLKTRAEFESTARHRNMVLGDSRGRAKFAVQDEAAKRLRVKNYGMVQALVDLGVELTPAKQAIVDKATQKQKTLDKAKADELQVFDPSADWD